MFGVDVEAATESTMQPQCFSLIPMADTSLLLHTTNRPFHTGGCKQGIVVGARALGCVKHMCISWGELFKTNATSY